MFVIIVLVSDVIVDVMFPVMASATGHTIGGGVFLLLMRIEPIDNQLDIHRPTSRPAMAP